MGPGRRRALELRWSWLDAELAAIAASAVVDDRRGPSAVELELLFEQDAIEWLLEHEHFPGGPGPAQ